MARQKQIEETKGKFIMGWAEFREGRMDEIRDDKRRLIAVDHKPPKIVTRLLVELPDGSCVPVIGEAFESLEAHAPPVPLKTIFPGKFKEMSSLPGKTYKKGDAVRIRKTVFMDNGYTIYDELD